MESHFTDIYERNEWGNNNESGYSGSSGGGSAPELNKGTYIPFLKQFINERGIKTVVDLGCGDFQCGPLIYNDLDILYTGYDTYKRVIEHNGLSHSLPKYKFIFSDLFSEKEDLESADLCIMKDILQHWTLSEIYSFLDYLVESRKYKYILIVNCCNQRKDDPENAERSTPLSAAFLPLKKYGPIKLFNYATKEVSLIQGTATF